jgi:hypothetical protein
MLERSTRREFLGALGGTTLGLVGSVAGLAGAPVRGPSGATAGAVPAGRHCAGLTGFRSAEHPDPRPDVDGSNVLTAEDLSGNPDLIPLFEGIAKIPHIADGIGCTCGCASDPSIRSLLSCYEKSSRMALFCEICQAEGRMAVRLHERGRTLEQIRAALDARFG